MERRFLQTELRVFSDADSGPMMRVQGYAAKYNTLSSNLGGFKERCAPGCFSRSISAGADVRALINHDPNLVLGRRSAGTVEISSDNVGLRWTCTLPDTSYARDLYALIKRGDVSQCSFAFSVEDEDWADETDPENGERVSIRTLRDVNLLDVSAVTYPAYEQTNVGVSSRTLFPDGLPSKMPVEVRSRIYTAATQETRDAWDLKVAEIRLF
jgi:Escherichia/Staphylococcus phage prohead protease